jgi:hypothetical protein
MFSDFSESSILRVDFLGLEKGLNAIDLLFGYVWRVGAVIAHKTVTRISHRWGVSRVNILCDECVKIGRFG